MGDLSLLDGQRYTAPSEITANSTWGPAIFVGNVDTWSNWTELVPATAQACGMLTIILRGSNVARWLVDIAVGSAGNERVVIPNLHWGINVFGPMVYSFPISVPAGSRISARARYNPGTGAKTIIVGVIVGGNTLLTTPLSQVVAYGPETTTNGLVAVDCGATANTRSGWVEIAAATDRPSRWAVVGLGHDFGNDGTSATYLLDIGIGAAGSEQVIIPSLPFCTTSALDGPFPLTYALPISIPAGSRLAVRAQCSVTITPDRVLDVGLWLAS
jgi:hypothetical protein